VHKAPRIESYDLIESKLKNGNTYYGFHFYGNRQTFEARTQKYFQIEGTYLPDAFETDLLHPEEKLIISFNLSTDQDKYLDLFSGSFFNWIGFSSNSEQDKISKRGEKFDYLHIQVVDKNGVDVLAEETQRSKIVLQALNKYRAYIN